MLELGMSRRDRNPPLGRPRIPGELDSMTWIFPEIEGPLGGCL